MIVKDEPSLVDLHNHLVPGVDDGARDIAAVLASVERMRADGIGRIVTTPHIQASLAFEPGRMKERLDQVTEAWVTASEAIAGEFPDVEYHRGHEVLVDVPEPDLSDARLRMSGTSFVLIEWPRMHVPPGTHRVIRWIREAGYRPVIAHPERYAGMGDVVETVALWRASGAYLQVNYGSLAGRYGADARTAALRILEAGQADYLASDFHGRTTLKIYKKEAWELLEERSAHDALELLCRANPARLLEDLDPLPVAPLEHPKLLSRIRGMIGRSRRALEGQTG